MLTSLMTTGHSLASSVSLEDITGNANSNFPNTTITTNATNSHASGQSQLSWVIRTDSPSGAQVSAYVTGIATTGNAVKIADSILVSVSPSQGTASVTPDGAFASGVTLSSLPRSADSAVNLCHTSRPGDGNFVIMLTTSSPSANGSGTVSGIINLIASTP